ncbi:hypothetical protein Back2_20220 [Nocardioides baekrokdamisoli]|uniref:Uncharacterized protein n=1 Tax=Nocardioides baekrokdamisoli TaxID=1804624 RepID=A0A3G9INW4_9ACTN|nr:hypothetical protein [Nocardioides baekrokdamisoli]BBH17735.1 hypothetical protein Back2_20220 [Nocardioides baekrokdamisoli]
MGGWIKIDDRAWTASTWLFDAVMRTIASQTTSTTLRAQCEEIEKEHLGALNLQDLSPGDQAEVRRVLAAGFVDRLDEQHPGFDPRSKPSAFWIIAELVELAQ